MNQAREENGDLFGYGDGHELLTQHLDQLELPDDPEYSGVMQSMLQVFKTVVHSHKGEADTLPMALLLVGRDSPAAVAAVCSSRLKTCKFGSSSTVATSKSWHCGIANQRPRFIRSSPRTASGKANYGSLIYLVANHLNIRQNGGV